MGLSKFLLIILFASSAIECAKSKEICDCVPLNICPEYNRFNKEDAKYFKTVLKCKEVNYVRCCPDNASVNSALRRSDDAENVILIDDVDEFNFGEATTESDPTTFSPEFDSTATEAFDDLLTTDVPNPDEMETTETLRKSKMVDHSISVIYPNHKYPETDKKKQVMEHLFLIFPNGEIEAASATSRPLSNDVESSLDRPMKRVIVRKRLIKKTSDSLEGAESKISEAVIEPNQMDIEEVKQRLSAMHRQNRRRKPSEATTTSSTTESPVEETTVKKPRRKRIKVRKQPTSTEALLIASTTFKSRNEKVESSTMKPSRKIIYDTRSRTNFLKRPSSQQIDDDDMIEPEVTTTTERLTAPTVNYVSFESVFTTPSTPLVVRAASQIDIEHKAMIETVHKTLSAIHKGVDIKFVEKMLESHKVRMKEMRKNPPATQKPNVESSRPYRGSATFRKPATTPAQNHSDTPAEQTKVRTRNLSRTRNTPSTTQTTQKSVRKSPRTSTSHVNPLMNSNSLLEEVDMPPKQKPPVDFRPSPLFGLTMDRENEFDRDMIEKIHDTLKPSADIQNGFFPVIQNGTPSTLL